MSSSDTRYERLTQIINRLHTCKSPAKNGIGKKINYSGLSLWFNQENTKVARDNLSRKRNGHAGTTPTDIGLLTAITILEQEGYQLDSAEFDENLNLVSIKKNGTTIKI